MSAARVARWKAKPWPEWVGMSRTLAFAQLGLWGIQLADDLRMTLELVISELVTNAVQHGGPRQEHVTVSLLAIDELVMVEVIDTSHIHHLPELAAVDDDAEGGRGLALVEALAHQWGYYPTATGKSVWAIIGQPSAPAPLALPPATTRPTTRKLRADVYHRARPDPQIHAIPV